MKHILIGFFLLSGFCWNAQAQQSTVLQNNPRLKWYQINTPNFRVIYPKGFESEANRMANTLEHIREPESNTIGTAPKKISLVLQSQSSVSNGFVSILPRRSEFYTMPSQNYNFQGNNDWLNLLASHEYRHMAQYQHANRGFNRFAYTLFGNNGLAALSYISVPPWFWEGDAVVTETAFTSSGRGRIPNFDLVFRTNLLEGRTFNYHKQFLRSYKHNIPDHYVLGYHMVSYLRRRTNNPEVWEKITANSWSKSIMPFTFSNSIYKETGLHVVDLYKEMANELKTQWINQLDTTTFTSFSPLHSRKNSSYTDFKYPFQINGDTVLVMKSGIGDIEQFILLSGEGQKKVFTPGPINNTGMISYANRKLVWNEYRYDPRFRVHTYSVIMTYDLDTRLSRQVSRLSRYASAGLSPDGTKIVTVETDSEYKTSLVVLNYADGSVLKKFDNPGNDFYSMPRWSEDSKDIIVLITRKNEKSLASVNFASGAVTVLRNFGEENIGYPVPYKNFILYNSPVSGIDNIYALDRNTGLRYKVTGSRLGAYNPFVSSDGKTIFYNEQKRDGMDVVTALFDPANWQRVPENITQPNTFFGPLVEQEGRPELLDSIPQNNYSSTRYSQLKNMFNVYSWGAYVYNDLYQVNVGVSSQDILSTTSLNAGYTFDLNEGTGAWKAGISYQKFVPIIDVQVSDGSRKSDQGDITLYDISGQDSVTQNLTFQWNERTLEAGARIPLITTTSRYVGSFSIANYVGYSYITNFENSIDGGGRLLPSSRPQYFFRDFADQGTLLYNRFGMTAYRLLKQSRRDINSKWGQYATMSLYATPYGGDYEGAQFSFQGRMYFPGFFKHHSIWGYWAYQQSLISDVSVRSGEGLDNYTFRNNIPLPRGHSVSRFEEFYSMSANYTLPLWYPDISVGPLVNLQRVRANFFLDYGFGNSNVNGHANSQTYTSVGTEVKFDVNVFRLLPQLDIGFRYSYGISPSVTKFEFLMGAINF